MSDLPQLIERNQQFAARYEGNLSLMPRLSTMVLTCADARVDPAHFLGLDLGDALVFRSAGARISEAFERELSILWAMAQRMAGDNFRGFELAIVHHTDCAFERLANPEIQQALSQNLGVDQTEIASRAIADHEQSLRDDIERLRQSPLVPKALTVSGHIYDVEDGVMRQVVAPTPLQSNH